MGTVNIEMTPKQIKAASRHFFKALNQAQALGFTIDEVIAAGLYACGVAIKMRGASLLVDEPLSVALPPVVLGFEDAEFDPAKLRKKPDSSK